MAVYLRFQLPPLHLSNVECVDFEMNHLLGVVGKKAQKIINDLDVVSAVSLALSTVVQSKVCCAQVLPSELVGIQCTSYILILFAYRCGPAEFNRSHKSFALHIQHGVFSFVMHDQEQSHCVCPLCLTHRSANFISRIFVM